MNVSATTKQQKKRENIEFQPSWFQLNHCLHFYELRNFYLQNGIEDGMGYHSLDNNNITLLLFCFCLVMTRVQPSSCSICWNEIIFRYRWRCVSFIAFQFKQQKKNWLQAYNYIKLAFCAGFFFFLSFALLLLFFLFFFRFIYFSWRYILVKIVHSMTTNKFSAWNYAVAGNWWDEPLQI